MHEYKNDKITVRWDAKVCIHSAVCVRSLPGVFDTTKKPWVNVDGSDANEIAKTIMNCPSGALSYVMPDSVAGADTGVSLVEIKIQENGPLYVKGEVRIIGSDGTETIKSGNFALCRCGSSANKPYCDGTHKKNGIKS